MRAGRDAPMRSLSFSSPQRSGGGPTPADQRLARVAGGSATFESLETRRLMSIVWTDRGTADGFDAAFGANATTARAVVDRALVDWQAVVNDFAPGASTFNVSIQAGDLGPGALGATYVTGRATVNGAERPTSALIDLDNNGGGSGWYFD